MNIRQALKQKTKLISEIKDLQSIVKSYNSRSEGAPIRYDIEATLAEIEIKMEALVALKAKLHAANLPVYEKIFRMAELKSYATFLKNVPTDEGTVLGRFGADSTVKVVSLDNSELRYRVKGVESLIELLQEELDIYNATTEI